MSAEPAARAEPSKPKKGKGSAVLLRVTQELRDAMDTEAERTGRSLSHVGERWLDEAHRGRSDFLARAGGPMAAAAFERLALVAQAVREAAGDPAKDEFAALVLRRAWETAVSISLPEPPPSVQSQAVEEADTRLKEASAALLIALADAEAGWVFDAAPADAMKSLLLGGTEPNPGRALSETIFAARDSGGSGGRARELRALIEDARFGQAVPEATRAVLDASAAYIAVSQALEDNRRRAAELGFRLGLGLPAQPREAQP